MSQQQGKTGTVQIRLEGSARDLLIARTILYEEFDLISDNEYEVNDSLLVYLEVRVPKQRKVRRHHIKPRITLIEQPPT